MKRIVLSILVENTAGVLSRVSGLFSRRGYNIDSLTVGETQKSGMHIEASDEAGHEGNFDLKQLTIENLDKRVVGPIYEAVKDWEEPVAIAVLPDHPTPCELRTHTAEPVPFLIYYPGIEPDGVQTFDEIACAEGIYGVMKENEFMNEFMKI